MHDPEVVAFRIRRPFPEKPRRVGATAPQWRWQIHYQDFYVSPFITVAGREFYFPDLVTVWHREPINGQRKSVVIELCPCQAVK